MGINVGNKVIHPALALIFLISFTSIANAGKETMIVGSRLTLSPSIYGNIATWADTEVWKVVNHCSFYKYFK